MFNLFLGFILPDVDNMAHIGGLLTGLVFGLLFVPSRVPTMRSLWVRPGPTPGTTVPVFGAGGTSCIRVAGLLLVAAAFVVAVDDRRGGLGLAMFSMLNGRWPRITADGVSLATLKPRSRAGSRPSSALGAAIEARRRRGRARSQATPGSTS